MTMNVSHRTAMLLPLLFVCAITGCNQQASDQATQGAARADAAAAEKLQQAKDKQAKQVATASRDLQKSQQEAREKIADKQADVAAATNDANKDVAKARADYVRDTADASYDVAKTKAEGDLKVAREQCDQQYKGDARDACQTRAQAAYERELADAKAAYEQAKRTASTTEKQ
jgi:hypothetical protein